MFYETGKPGSCAIVVQAFSLIVKNTLFRKYRCGYYNGCAIFVGKYNYGIYLAHALVLYFLEDPFGINYKLCTPIISIPLTALSAFGLSLLLVWLINKLPWVGKWISG